MVKIWGDGFWNLLVFGMQTAFIIVTGHALASSAPAKSLLCTVISAAKTPVQGAMLIIFFSSIVCVINWGSGLVVGAVLTHEVARRVSGSDYPLFIACVYIGFPIWDGGFSESMPLLATTPGSPAEHIAGLIPVGGTLFSGFNIFITVALIVVMSFITHIMMPKPPDMVSIDPELLMEKADFQKQLPKDAPSSERPEESRILTLVTGALGIACLVIYFSEHGFNITTNTTNLMFMIAGLLLHRTPMAHMRAISAVARNTAGILAQFPFHAGVQLVMEHFGLGGLITEFFINVANKDIFPVMTFFSSTLVNFVVPSGGGHWAVQGPFVTSVAQTLGADFGKSIMAIAYGEQWMNMAQPFWALPAPAIAGFGARDIMGCCITVPLFSSVIFIIGLTLLWRHLYKQEEYKMKNCVAVSAVRTAIGGFNGSLVSTGTIGLGTIIIKVATERTKIDS